MTYGAIVKVPQPIETYEVTHAEVMKILGDASPPGLIFHVARATDEGFEVYEVWESKEQRETFNTEVLWPAVERSEVDTEGPQPVLIEFEPHGLITPPQTVSS